MRRIFSAGEPFQVPDGTWLSPFLNPFDSESGLGRREAEALEKLSIAQGLIKSGTCSKIHYHPYTALVTFVLDGELVIRMDGADDDHRDRISLARSQAVLAEPGTFFQLINESARDTSVLYIASPAYVFLADANGDVVYDDAVVLDEQWHELEEREWKPSRAAPGAAARSRARDAALSRLPPARPS